MFFRETQSVWERRAPLGPQHVRKLVKQGIKVNTVLFKVFSTIQTKNIRFLD